jgi:hypothetical protein
VFRGQRDANWKLTPTAARNGDQTFLQVGMVDDAHVQEYATGPNAWPVRLVRLNAMLRYFADVLNEQGLVIPSGNPPLGNDRNMEIPANLFPVRTAFPLMALAQHHGLPTLFLDWTRRAWVAAYFAACDAATVLKQSPRQAGADEGSTAPLAVWALARNADRRDRSDQVQFYEAPASTNPNLRAQSGLFTWWTSEGAGDLSLEEYIAWLAQRRNMTVELRRFLLPVAEAPRLLRLLAIEHVHGAALFPGVDGVVRAMRERTLWDTWEESTPGRSYGQR